MQDDLGWEWVMAHFPCVFVFLLIPLAASALWGTLLPLEIPLHPLLLGGGGEGLLQMALPSLACIPVYLRIHATGLH